MHWSGLPPDLATAPWRIARPCDLSFGSRRSLDALASIPVPHPFFAVGRGGDGRLVGFLALRPPTSDSVRIRVSPKWETSGANESTFFFGD